MFSVHHNSVASVGVSEADSCSSRKNESCYLADFVGTNKSRIAAIRSCLHRMLEMRHCRLRCNMSHMHPASCQFDGLGASCSPLSHGAGPCPALWAAATSFFRACAGAIEKANRPSPETRAGLRRHVPPTRRAHLLANSHLYNPSTELARLRADCKASRRCGLSAAETLSSRRQV